jgi:hypothetical protein
VACTSNAQCTSPLVCAGSICVAGCATNTDCPEGLICGSLLGTKICVGAPCGPLLPCPTDGGLLTPACLLGICVEL